MGAGNAVNSHLAVVENWRDIAEAGRNVKWRRNVAIIPWVVGGRPGAMDELRVRLDSGTNGAAPEHTIRHPPAQKCQVEDPLVPTQAPRRAPAPR